jgi:hypothetical protein
MARAVKNALDDDCVFAFDVENQIFAMHRDPHARSVLFPQRVTGGVLGQLVAMRPQFVNEAQRGLRTVPAI